MPTKVELFARYARSAWGFWRGKTGWIAWSLFVFLIALIVFQLFIQYRINFWNRDFFNALSKRDVAQVWKEAWLFLPLFLCSVMIAVLTVWAKMKAQRTWRKWLSQHMINRWVEDDHYLHLTNLKNHPRNAEYRIAEDARVATDLPFELLLGLISSVLTALTFIGVLWQVGGSLNVTMFGVSLTIPGYLVLVALGYSALLTTATVLFARNLTLAVEHKNSSEAEFRSAASKLRSHSEGENKPYDKKGEINAVNTTLDRVIEAWRLLCLQLMRTTFVSTANSILAPVIGLLFCTPKYLADGLTIGQVVQAAAAFVTVQNSFNWLLNNYPSIADWLSSSNRVALLLFGLDRLEKEK